MVTAASPPSLRARLIDLAEREIETIGHEALSLRALAAAAGVAPSAPYRHFRDRADLLVALAERGFAILAESHLAAAQANEPPARRLEIAVWNFIAFARAHPALFRLMFTSDALRGTPEIDRAGQSFTIFEAMVAATRLGQDGRAQLHSLSLWSALHGVALLELDGRFERFNDVGIATDAIIADLIDRFR
ncbi:MAG: hypothetical protein RIS94_3108 [Pseudomonadota bacterium]|jgi:AcrR family transcriptional regulator